MQEKERCFRDKPELISFIQIILMYLFDLLGHFGTFSLSVCLSRPPPSSFYTISHGFASSGRHNTTTTSIHFFPFYFQRKKIDERIIVIAIIGNQKKERETHILV